MNAPNTVLGITAFWDLTVNTYKAARGRNKENDRKSKSHDLKD